MLRHYLKTDKRQHRVFGLVVLQKQVNDKEGKPKNCIPRADVYCVCVQRATLFA